MSTRMAWVAWVATVGALLLGVVVGVVALPSNHLAAFAVGVVVGLVVGAIAFVFAWFRGPPSSSHVAIRERIEELESELRVIDEQLEIARYEALPELRIHLAALAGQAPHSTPAAKVAAKAKVTRLEGERAAKLAKLALLGRES